jgi:multiple antibiotic resistance protein
MMNELTFFFNTFVALFVIIDPFALVPVYLMLTERFSKEERRHARRKATIVGLAMLFTFALTGMSLFKLFGITMPAFQIAGGILLMMFGISQLNSNRQRVTKDEQEEGLEKDDISIFPLGTPLIAGPGAISTVVLFASEAETTLRMANLLTAIVTGIGVTYWLLSMAPYIYRVLGKTGLNLVTRIMGLIVTAVGVQFVLTGIQKAFSL